MRGKMTVGTLETIEDETGMYEEEQHAGGISGHAAELGGLCHSLNQPLMAISGLSEIMAMQMAEEDPLKPKMIKLTRQVDKMSAIVREIMNVSKQG